MKRAWDRLLQWVGVEPRAFHALTRVFLAMDLRGQHFARATATSPQSIFGPLFFVVAQCLFLSASASLLLFARTDVFFFALVGLSLSLLVTTTSLLVEFDEVILDARDLEILGPRPIAPRTYAAARLANLCFYLGLMFLSLNLFPLLLGVGLRDVGPWYFPAYLLASMTGTCVLVAVLVSALSFGWTPRSLDTIKEVLAWTQIVLVGVVFYGGQMMLRDGTHQLLAWGAFPPAWVQWVPSAWLARFVESASVAPSFEVLGVALGLLGLMLASVALLLWRLTRMYRTMQPLASHSVHHVMPSESVGRLGGRFVRWGTRGAEERVGFWMTQTFLARDVAMKLRALWPINLAVIVIVLGLMTGHFANPMSSKDRVSTMFAVLAVYFIPMAIPPMLHNLTAIRDYTGFWLLASAPLARPAGVALGMAKAVTILIITPLSLLFWLVLCLAWDDVVSASLHAGLAWVLSALLARASLWLVLTDFPFSVPPARGSSLGPMVLPLAGISAVLMTLATLQVWFASSPWFWAGIGLTIPALWIPIRLRAEHRMNRLWSLRP